MPYRILGLVARVLPCANPKDLVKFFKGKRFGLGDEEEYEEPADYAPRGVPAEGALRLEGGQEVRPGEAEDEIETPCLSRDVN